MRLQSGFACAAAVVLLGAVPAVAQDYPVKPVRTLVTLPPAAIGPQRAIASTSCTPTSAGSGTSRTRRAPCTRARTSSRRSG